MNVFAPTSVIRRFAEILDLERKYGAIREKLAAITPPPPPPCVWTDKFCSSVSVESMVV